MKLRTFDREPVRAKLSTDSAINPDDLPVLLVNDEPFSPEEAEFFLESANKEELEMLSPAKNEPTSHRYTDPLIGFLQMVASPE